MAIRISKNRILRAALGAALLAACACFAVSCTPVIGWGVVLWNFDSRSAEPGEAEAAAETLNEEAEGASEKSLSVEYIEGLSNGQIVPIYVKSNIQNSYIIGVPGTRRKAELPIWRLERFSSKSKAMAFRKEMEPCLDLWGIATRNALIMRERPDTSGASSQVYRLREREMIKMLRKVVGAEVKTGDKKLEGDWYQAMSSDGTRGYVFSNTLSLLDSSKMSISQSAASLDRKKRDESIELVLSKTWRPEIFRKMIDEQRYDLDEFSMRYGMFSDMVKKQIRIELPNLSEVFNYTESTRLKPGLFGFQGTNLQIQVRGDDILTVSFPDDNGKSKALVMVLVEEDMEALARAEENRRQAILEGIIAKGAILTSDTYGELVLSGSRRFGWKGYDLLSPAVIPGGMGDSGEIAFDRYVDEGLAGSFDGVINFMFDSLPKGDAVRFFYKLNSDGMKLEQMPPDAFDATGLTAVKRGSGPIVAFFSFGG